MYKPGSTTPVVADSENPGGDEAPVGLGSGR